MTFCPAFRKIEAARKSYEVERFHTEFTFRKQNLGWHSANAVIILETCFPNCTKEQILACLIHDCGEYLSGDVPAPAKWLFPGIKEACDSLQKHWEDEYDFLLPELTEQELEEIKFADNMELLFFCFEEYKLGNRKMRLLFEKVCSIIVDTKQRDLSEIGHDLFNDIRIHFNRWDDQWK